MSRPQFLEDGRSTWTEAIDRQAAVFWAQQSLASSDGGIERKDDDAANLSDPQTSREIRHWYWFLWQTSRVAVTTETRWLFQNTNRILVQDSEWRGRMVRSHAPQMPGSSIGSTVSTFIYQSKSLNCQDGTSGTKMYFQLKERSGRLRRWRLRLMELELDIFHHAGINLQEADALFRFPTVNGYAEPIGIEVVIEFVLHDDNKLCLVDPEADAYFELKEIAYWRPRRTSRRIYSCPLSTIQPKQRRLNFFVKGPEPPLRSRARNLTQTTRYSCASNKRRCFL